MKLTPRVIDAFFLAANKPDLEGLRDASNFPFIRIARGKVTIYQARQDFTQVSPPGAAAEGWHHRVLDSAQFIQSGSHKVDAITSQRRVHEELTCPLTI